MPKYIKAYKPFLEFVKTIEKSSKTDQDKKLINLILKYFDSIFEKGPQSGQRSKHLFNLIEQHGDKTPTDITYPDIQAQESNVEFERLKSLVLENFRGFSSEETFNLNKQYTFIYGPNGSGKSSLFEALEYSMLGFVQGALDKNIETDEYIKNHFSGVQSNPKLIGITKTGTTDEIKPSARYNFCFIEKSRIDRFSRISANTDKSMEKQLASLFGLEEFNKFVNDFNKDVDKYFGLDNVIEKSFAEKTATISGRKQSVVAEQINLETYKANKAKIISDAGCKTAEEFEEIYIKASEGKKTKAEVINESLRSPAPQLINFSTVTEMKNQLKDSQEDYDNLKKIFEELISRKSELQFKDFFSSAINVESLSPNACPLCETLMDKVHVHPFKNAKLKLNQLNEVIDLEKKAESLYGSLFNKLSGIENSIASFNSALTLIERSVLTIFSTEKTEKDIKRTADLLKRYAEVNDYFTSKEDMLKREQTHFESKNTEIQKTLNARTNLESELRQIDGVKNNYNEQKIHLSSTEKHISDWQKEVNDFETSNAILIAEVQKEKERISQNKLWEAAYKRLTDTLIAYKDKLPINYVGELSELTCTIFNLINHFDKDYEKADSIILPKSTGDIIQITFSGDKSKNLDALCVLSEGHLRCLGLAILLSKNINEECPVLIFDDVVNAIDTEHRTGIKDLLFNYEPLFDKQLIITTHDDDFAIRLASKVPKEKTEELVQMYNFNMDETSRKINIDQDTKNHLQKAFNEYSNGKIKESLKTGRLALENIAYELWRKLSKNQRVSVGISAPKAKPELNDLITKLNSLITKEKIEKFSEVSQYFDFLLKKENWKYFNQASHEGEDDPILDKVVAKEILEKCVLIDSIVKNRPVVKKVPEPEIKSKALTTEQISLF
jgi:AAA15 family ATPase/GTPase